MKKLALILALLLPLPASAQNYLQDTGIFNSVVQGTTTNQLLYNSAGTLAGATVGAGLSLSGGTLTGASLPCTRSATSLQYNNAGVFGCISGSSTDGTTLTLVAPVLGTPASATLTNATGLPISTGLTGAGTGVLTALGINVGTAGSPLVNGGVLGTPSSGTATNLTGTATGLTVGNATNAVNTGVTDDTTTAATMYPAWVTANTGNLPLKTTSTKLTFNPSTGVLSSTSFTGAGTGLTGTAASLTVGTANAVAVGGITGLGTGVATALGTNVGTAGAFVVNGGALGTPSGGTLTNATGLPVSTGITGFGTGVATALAAAVNATGGIPSPTPTRAGDIIYWNGSNWVALAGNNSGTQVLQESSLGVPSWATISGTGTVTSITAGTGLTGGTITSTGTVAVDKASGANLEAGTSNKVLTADNIFDAEQTITYAASQTFDFSTFLNGRVTLTGNITSLTCSNIKASQSGTISLVQDATGSRTMVAGWCSQFRWSNGTRGVLSTAANAIDALFYTCVSTSICYVSLGKAQAN